MKRCRLLSTSEAVIAAMITARSPIPDSITTVATNRPEACLGVTSQYPTVDRLQREPQTLPIVGDS